MIKLNSVVLKNYDPSKHINIFRELTNKDATNNFIKQVNDRLNRINKNEVTLKFEQAYLVVINDVIVGYLYITGVVNNSVYLEYLILPKERKQGYAKLLLEEVVDYLFNNFNLLKINLDIDVSNIASINVAESVGFVMDDIENNKLAFVRDNQYFVDEKRR